MSGYVISVSSIPPRFHKIGVTLKCLVAQRPAPERIILWIPHKYRRFPDWDGSLPDVPEGVEIIRCEEDFGPATKVLPAARMYAGTDMDILFCDDDMHYRRGWARQFLRGRTRQPRAALTICRDELLRADGTQGPREFQPRALRSWRVTDIEFQLRLLYYQLRWRFLNEPEFVVGRRVTLRGGYVDHFEGFGGVMVRGDYFPERAYDIPEVFWAVDDVWLSGMLAVNNVPIYALPRVREPSPFTQTYQQDALHMAVIDGATREEANEQARQYFRDTYGVWPD